MKINIVLNISIIFVTLETIQSLVSNSNSTSSTAKAGLRSGVIILPEYSKFEVTLLRNSSLNYRPVHVELSKQYGFVIIQSHSLYIDLIASLTPTYSYGNQEKSNNAGVIKRVNDPTVRAVTVYVSGNKKQDVDSVLLAVPSVPGSPIPGGCCLTCALELDPNINLSFDLYRTYITFQRASRWTPSTLLPDCDGSENPRTLLLRYSVYYYYVNENDLSEHSLYDGLWKMSTPSNIKKYGNHLVDITGAESLSVDTEAVFRQGVVFNVIVSDESTGGDVRETAYVPVSTYACDFVLPAGSPRSCHSKRSVVLMVFCIAFACIGLVLCFAGYKLFRITVFLFGCVFYWFFIYVLLSKFGGHGVSEVETFVISFIVSLCGGGFTLFLFAFKRWFYVVYLQVTIVFGMFISAVLFYTPFGYLDVWNVDYRFGLGFASIALLVTMVFLFFPKLLIYNATSLLGGYAVIMTPCFFVGANMHYILLTVVYRLTVTNFGTTFLRRPFGKLEYILTGVWAFLYILGTIVQYCTTRNDDFYFSGKAARHKMWDKFSQSINLDKRRKRNRTSPRRLYYERLASSNEIPDEKAPANNGYQNFYGSTSAASNPAMNLSDESQEFQPLIHVPHREARAPPWVSFSQHSTPSNPPQEASPSQSTAPSANLIIMDDNSSERQPLVPAAPNTQRFNTFQRERYPKIV